MLREKQIAARIQRLPRWNRGYYKCINAMLCHEDACGCTGRILQNCTLAFFNLHLDIPAYMDAYVYLYIYMFLRSLLVASPFWVIGRSAHALATPWTPAKPWPLLPKPGFYIAIIIRLIWKPWKACTHQWRILILHMENLDLARRESWSYTRRINSIGNPPTSLSVEHVGPPYNMMLVP